MIRKQEVRKEVRSETVVRKLKVRSEVRTEMMVAKAQVASQVATKSAVTGTGYIAEVTPLVAPKSQASKSMVSRAVSKGSGS
jgi:hypothetical protein